VRKALSWPARLIAINAGEDGSVVVGKMLDKATYAFGYNAQAGEYRDLTSQGVIDPMTHDVAYQSLLLDHRRLLHGRIVEAIELLFAEQLPEWIDRLAHHAVRAGDDLASTWAA